MRPGLMGGGAAALGPHVSLPPAPGVHGHPASSMARPQRPLPHTQPPSGTASRRPGGGHRAPGGRPVAPGPGPLPGLSQLISRVPVRSQRGLARCPLSGPGDVQGPKRQPLRLPDAAEAIGPGWAVLMEGTVPPGGGGREPGLSRPRGLLLTPTSRLPAPCPPSRLCLRAGAPTAPEGQREWTAHGAGLCPSCEGLGPQKPGPVHWEGGWASGPRGSPGRLPGGGGV